MQYQSIFLDHTALHDFPGSSCVQKGFCSANSNIILASPENRDLVQNQSLLPKQYRLVLSAQTKKLKLPA